MTCLPSTLNGSMHLSLTGQCYVWILLARESCAPSLPLASDQRDADLIWSCPCLVPRLLAARCLHCPPCPPCPPKAAGRSQTTEAAQALIRAAAPRSLHLWEDPAFWALPAALPSRGEIAKDLLETRLPCWRLLVGPQGMVANSGYRSPMTSFPMI